MDFMSKFLTWASSSPTFRKSQNRNRGAKHLTTGIEISDVCSKFKEKSRKPSKVGAKIVTKLTYSPGRRQTFFLPGRFVRGLLLRGHDFFVLHRNDKLQSLGEIVKFYKFLKMLLLGIVGIFAKSRETGIIS